MEKQREDDDWLVGGQMVQVFWFAGLPDNLEYHKKPIHSKMLMFHKTFLSGILKLKLQSSKEY